MILIFVRLVNLRESILTLSSKSGILFKTTQSFSKHSTSETRTFNNINNHHLNHHNIHHNLQFRRRNKKRKYTKQDSSKKTLRKDLKYYLALFLRKRGHSETKERMPGQMTRDSYKLMETISILLLTNLVKLSCQEKR